MRFLLRASITSVLFTLAACGGATMEDERYNFCQKTITEVSDGKAVSSESSEETISFCEKKFAGHCSAEDYQKLTQVLNKSGSNDESRVAISTSCHRAFKSFKTK